MYLSLYNMIIFNPADLKAGLIWHMPPFFYNGYLSSVYLFDPS